jgi:hypothetical protein
MVKNYIDGQVVLGKLELELPDVYEDVIRRKTDREGELETECATNTSVPGQFFKFHPLCKQITVAGRVWC